MVVVAGGNGQGIPPEGSKAKVVPVLLPVSRVPGSGAHTVVSGGKPLTDQQLLIL